MFLRSNGKFCTKYANKNDYKFPVDFNVNNWKKGVQNSYPYKEISCYSFFFVNVLVKFEKKKHIFITISRILFTSNLVNSYGGSRYFYFFKRVSEKGKSKFEFCYCKIIIKPFLIFILNFGKLTSGFQPKVIKD